MYAVAAILAILGGCGGGGGADGSQGGGGGSSSAPSGVGWVTRQFIASGAAPGLGNSLAWSGRQIVAVSPTGGWRSGSSAAVWLANNAFLWFNDVAWDGHGFVAVGDNLLIGNSGDGVNWSTIGDTGSSASLTGVAGSGTDWVAVGAGGTLMHASASDPKTWTAVSSPTGRDLLAVTWSGRQFVAVGAAGTVLTSPSGTAWTLQPAAGTADLASIAAASPTSFVAMTRTSPGTLLASADAASWSTVYTASSTQPLLNRVAYLNGFYLALGNTVTATSTDASSWTTSGPLRVWLNAAIYDGSRFIAIGSDTDGDQGVFASSDGLNWTSVVIAMDLAFLARSPVDGRLVATTAGHSSRVQTSLDSITWQYGDVPDFLFMDVAWAPSLGVFASLMSYGSNQYLYTSSDGQAWTQVVEAPCYGGLAASTSVLVSVSPALTSGSAICTSTSGTQWTAAAGPGSAVYNRAVWTGAQLLAVGSGGALATATPDGATWTARSSGVTTALNGAASSGSRIVVVGNAGTVIGSTDGGQTWTAASSGTTANLNNVIWTGKEFAAVGTNATLLRSPDGAAWKIEPTPYAPGLSTYTLDFGDVSWSSSTSLLTVVGSRGFVATVP
jgi:hypothetical protein